MVKTHDNGCGIYSSHDHSSGRELNQPLSALKHIILKSCKDGADNYEGCKCRKENCRDRNHKEVYHFGNYLVKPFFNLTHYPYRDHDRYDMSLIAVPRNRSKYIITYMYISEKIPCRNYTRVYSEEAVNGVGISYIPAVKQACMYHHKPEHCRKEHICSEYSCSTDCYYNRKECKCGICNHIQKCVPVCLCKRRYSFTECLNDTHHKTGGYDSREYRYKYISD